MLLWKLHCAGLGAGTTRDATVFEIVAALDLPCMLLCALSPASAMTPMRLNVYYSASKRRTCRRSPPQDHRCSSSEARVDLRWQHFSHNERSRKT
eukprot:2479588-Amphidinium_carterae.1